MGGKWAAAKVGLRSIPEAKHYEDIRDPANGEKVPRCKVCGLPGSDGNQLLDGIWRTPDKARRLRLCERCIGPDVPVTADPFQLPETG